jgi:hypothetical protein
MLVSTVNCGGMAKVVSFVMSFAVSLFSNQHLKVVSLDVFLSVTEGQYTTMPLNVSHPTFAKNRWASAIAQCQFQTQTKIAEPFIFGVLARITLLAVSTGCGIPVRYRKLHREQPI